MPLSSGARLGPYEVLTAIGAGGMGEVYEARDTRLDRSVAIKVLPPQFSPDPERRARFEREAKTIASLNHPHICTLHDVGEHEGSTFLVMEHLTGETLAQRLEKGPLPLEQALTVATEIADALSAAHRQGVIHRDLKPGNVMLTKAGAKLLDFGLAKLKGHGEHPAATHLATAPTQSTPLTGEGMIVGTLQYMAPEQVEGKPADARTDLWALGAILHEMVTGKRAFEGTSAASLITAIMSVEPAPLSALQPLTPPSVDRLVRQCLAKAPEDRPDTAHDVANDLRWLREASGGGALTGVQPRRRRRLRTALEVGGGLLLFVAGAGAMWLLRPLPSRASLAGLSLNVRPAEEVAAGGAAPFVPTPGGSRTALTWTPDGQALVFVGRRGGVQQLYIRRLDVAEAHPLAGTEDAQMPAVSPDGQWVAFWANGAIRKTSLDGGPVMDLVPGVAQPPWGLVWDARGGLLFGGEDNCIRRISREVALAAVTTAPRAGQWQSHGLPCPLPGGRALLYTVRKRAWSWGDEEIVAQTLATGVQKTVLKDAADARYVATGHLVFLRRGVLFAVPFDATRMEVRGPEVPMLDTVAQALTASVSTDVTGAGQFAVAPTGMLAWIPSPVVPYPEKALVTVDRRGQVTSLPAPARSYGYPRVSPDARRLAVTVRTLTEAGLWVYDLGRETLTPLTLDGEIDRPCWSSDGQRLAFGWIKGGQVGLAAQPADGTTPPQMLVPGDFVPSSGTPDGKKLAGVPTGGGDVLIASAENGGGSVQPLWKTPTTERYPTFSPDGRSLAYVSDVSGRWEVYVRPYPGAGPAVPVSRDGGESPAWNPTGGELFFEGLPEAAGGRRMMAVDVAPGSPPRVGRPHTLFEFDPRDLSFACPTVRCYDVATDGQRFFAVQERASAPPPVVTHINLIQNWLEELKQKVPVR